MDPTMPGGAAAAARVGRTSSPEPGVIRVVLADDSVLFREGLARLLRTAFSSPVRRGMLMSSM
jgi:hypothetical protein